MPEVEGREKLLSALPKKRFTKFREYGTSQYAHSCYGEEDVYFHKGEPEEILLSGIFRTDNVTGKVRVYREPFYITRNPRTANQQTNRNKFADAVAYWQGLTEEEKKVYNQRAIGKHMSGYNLCIREYMKS